MSRWVTGIAIGLLTGMGLAAWLSEGAIPAGLLIMVAVIIILSLFSERQKTFFGMASVLALWAGVFLFLHETVRWDELPETVEFSGPIRVIERGLTKVFYRPVTFRPLAADWHGGDILYRAPIDFVGVPGEQFDFSCTLRRPENFEPGFDYRSLLASRGTGYLCEHGGESRLLFSEERNIRTTLYRTQSDFQSRANALLPEPESGLLTGLLIGGSDVLASETKAAFARAGLSHIVAVSGYNMSIVADGLVILALVFGLWRRWAVGIAVIGLALFLMVIDGSAASLRAALMAWLAFGAYFVGRPGASWNGLLIAATLMLIADPLLMRFDIGFQLSFLATLALLVFARHFETFGFFRTWYGKVAALFLTTITIELFTLPVIISAFGMVSLVAPLANTVILPIVPVAMFIGIAAIVSVALIPALGFLATLLAWLPLWAIIHSAEWFSNITGASVSGLDSSAVFAVLWYVGLGMAVYLLERFRKRYVLGMDH